jgi:hypothetical protein
VVILAILAAAWFLLDGISNLLGGIYN